MEYVNQIVSRINLNTLLDNQQLIFENILFSIGPLSALLAARYGYKTYRRYEFFVNILFALILIGYPQPLISLLLNSSFKPYHRFLCALYGVYFVHGALYTFMLRNTTDEGVYYGHIWSRIIEATLIIMDNFFVYFEGVHWNYKLLCFVTSFAIVVLAINAYFLIRIRKPSGILEDRANHVAKLDFYLFFACGLFIYAFPDHFCIGLTGSNESYRSLARAVGANVIAASFQSFFVSDFIFVNDKKTFMLSRLIGNQVELVVIFVGYYCLHALSKAPGLCWFVSLNLAYSLLVFYGYHITSSGVQKAKAN